MSFYALSLATLHIMITPRLCAIYVIVYTLRHYLGLCYVIDAWGLSPAFVIALYYVLSPFMRPCPYAFTARPRARVWHFSSGYVAHSADLQRPHILIGTRDLLLAPPAVRPRAPMWFHAHRICCALRRPAVASHRYSPAPSAC
jgi:hypothetical protein